MGLYMKIDGVTGDVTETNHKGWIELNNADWGMSRNVRSAVTSQNNRESTSAACKELSFSKPIDSASNQLVILAFSGKGKTVQIDLTRVEQNGETIVRKIELKNAILSAFDNPLSRYSEAHEVGSFNFTEITISDFISDAMGKSGSPSRITYDLTQAETL